MSYKPGRGKSYWMINSRLEVKQTENTGSDKSAKRINAGNSFKTQAEAEKFRGYVMDLAKHGYYNYQPGHRFFTKLLTALGYIILTLIFLAAICLIVDFIFWIYDIRIKLPI